ncbi:hypothetical protein BV22DRAFT_1052023 [Leucogyrophana mollusca]|uniref:Uncharacterized protein n=1 Tax=Leucogyrophana mollusca TaxID=85980 RepID=A0ACB8AYT6_9AGAM|nr:hypothetical protein BV22DRAFT_1052023 [Leucogyrophana mollusca]
MPTQAPARTTQNSQRAGVVNQFLSFSQRRSCSEGAAPSTTAACALLNPATPTPSASRPPSMAQQPIMEENPGGDDGGDDGGDGGDDGGDDQPLPEDDDIPADQDPLDSQAELARAISELARATSRSNEVNVDGFLYKKYAICLITAERRSERDNAVERENDLRRRNETLTLREKWNLMCSKDTLTHYTLRVLKLNLTGPRTPDVPNLAFCPSSLVTRSLMPVSIHNTPVAPAPQLRSVLRGALRSQMNAEAPTKGSAGSPLVTLAPSSSHTPSASVGSVAEVAATLSVVVPSTPATLPPSLALATPATPLSLATAPPASPTLSTAPIATLPVSSAPPPPVPQLALPQFSPAPDAPPVVKQGHYEFRLVDSVPIYNIPSFRGNVHIILGYGPSGVNNPLYQTRVDKGKYPTHVLPCACHRCLEGSIPYLCLGGKPDSKCYQCHVNHKPCSPWTATQPISNWRPQPPIIAWAAAPNYPEEPTTAQPTSTPASTNTALAMCSSGRKVTVKKEPRSPKASVQKAKGKAVASPRKLSCPRKKAWAASPSASVAVPTPGVVHHFWEVRVNYHRRLNNMLTTLKPIIGRFEAGTALTPINDSDDDSVEYLGERAADEESVEEDEYEVDEIVEDSTPAASSSRKRCR